MAAARVPPLFGARTFAAHEAFFVDEVRRWVVDDLGIEVVPERTAVYGASAGGELALALGIRRPDVFGAVLAASPGAGFRPTAQTAGAAPRTVLVAGREEPFFLENARRWADALRDAGCEVLLDARPGGHGDELWRGAFPDMVRWASRARD